MAETYKRLGNGVLGPTGIPVVIYSTSGATPKSAIVSNISIFNTSTSTAKEILISFSQTTPTEITSSYILPQDGALYFVTLQPEESVSIDSGIVLGNGNAIILSGDSDVSVSLFGVEDDSVGRYVRVQPSTFPTYGVVVPGGTGKQLLVRSLLVHNPTSTQDFFSVSIGDLSGNPVIPTGTFINKIAIGAKETVEIKLGLGIDSTQSLLASSILGELKFHTFGVVLND